MNHKTIGMIGCGNIGTALMKGMMKSNEFVADHIFAYDKNEEKVKDLSQSTHINIAKNIHDLVEKSDYIVLAIKPNSLREVMNMIRENFTESKVLISVVVGVAIDFYEKYLGDLSKIVRTMPNINILVNESMTLLSVNKNVDHETIEHVKKIFDSVGKTEVLEEKYMSEVTALTASSPAYVCIMIEAMADAAVLSGIPREISYKLASQAVLGSAKMILETNMHPAKIKDQVCSPAGTTIEAVYQLEKCGFRYALIEAMEACTKRAREIGKEIN